MKPAPPVTNTDSDNSFHPFANTPMARLGRDVTSGRRAARCSTATVVATPPSPVHDKEEEEDGKIQRAVGINESAYRSGGPGEGSRRQPGEGPRGGVFGLGHSPPPSDSGPRF